MAISHRSSGDPLHRKTHPDTNAYGSDPHNCAWGRRPEMMLFHFCLNFFRWVVKGHDTWQHVRSEPWPGLLQLASTYCRPWTHIALDFVTSLPTSKNTTVILSILSRSAHNCPQPLRALSYSLIKFSSFMVSDWGPQVICGMEDFLHCPEVQKHASGHETDSVISPSAVRVKLPPSLCIPPCFMSPRPMNYQVVLKAPCAAARVLTVTRKFMLSSSVTCSFEFPTVTSRQTNKLHTFR